MGGGIGRRPFKYSMRERSWRIAARVRDPEPDNGVETLPLSTLPVPSKSGPFKKNWGPWGPSIKRKHQGKQGAKNRGGPLAL